MTPARTFRWSRHDTLEWWRALVWSCCLLSIGLSGPAQLAALAPCFGPGERQERAPIEEDDETTPESGREANQAASEPHTRKRRPHPGALPNVSWASHLPHHAASAGYTPLPNTPFDAAGGMPLRC